MTTSKTAEKSKQEVSVMQISKGSVEVWLVGTAPLIYHSIASGYKASRELLLPARKQKKSELERKLKHDPVREYRESFYTFSGRQREAGAPTMFSFPASALKKAMATATTDMDGASKAGVGRLVTVEGHSLPVYGIPNLFMAPVRNSGIQRTPDIRTRGILPKWVICARISYVKPHISKSTLTNLLSAAGMMVGLGDWRPEKGGANGTFEIASPDDPEVKQLIEHGGVAAQEEHYWDPVPHDEYSGEMIRWFIDEATDRGLAPTLPREEHRQQVEAEQ